MRKRSAIGVLLILIIFVIGLVIWKNVSKQAEVLKGSHNKSEPIVQNNQETQLLKSDSPSNNNIISILPSDAGSPSVHNDSIPTNWKSYSYKNIALTFLYPDTWHQIGTEFNSINTHGNILSVMVSFSDTLSNSIFSIEYHLPPYGKDLYKIYKSEFNKSNLSKRKIKIGGSDALEIFSTKTLDIKGNTYNPPLQVIQIAFLDQTGNGEHFIRFETPTPTAHIEVIKFNHVLSTMKYSGNSTIH
ncbi:MAG: hypothetical protein ABIT05_02075 [Chitinophagaceae bacterium]